MTADQAPHDATTHRTVESAGVTLSVHETGDRTGATVVLVHGFPDNHHVWDRVVPLLAADHHVVTYDVRGTGESTAPEQRAGYRMPRLVDDLANVIGAVAPDGRPVHLVGHDWGSVQLWGAVMREATDARLRGRIASYTSISGPGLDLYGHFFKSGLKNKELTPVLRQASHSWYILAFQLPFVPELVFKRFGRRIQRMLSKRQGLGSATHWSDSFTDDAVHGVNLYRANGLSFREGTTDVPVQLIVPTKDAFLTPAVYEDVAQFAPRVERTDIVANHWVVRTQPDVIASKVAGFIHDHR